MPIVIWVKRKDYPSTTRFHAEEVMFNSGKYGRGDFEADMDAWPCTGERGHDCHQLLKDKSAGRKITLNITGDHGGYAMNHGKPFGSTGKIVYDDGTATITMG